MRKRIFAISLALLFVFTTVPVMAAEADFSKDELFEAVEAGDIQLAYADLGGVYVDLADGENQMYLNTGTRVYPDFSVPTADGFVWVWFEQKVIQHSEFGLRRIYQKASPTQERYESLILGGAVRSNDLTDKPPQASVGGRPQPVKQPEDVYECFIAGTLIATDKGLADIKVIQPADLVYAGDYKTGEQGLQTVLRTYVHEVDELVHITIETERISTTRKHPFYVVGSGWVEAGKLCEADQLVLLSGKLAQITNVEIEKLDTPIPVYNLEVAGYHTYYVGEAGVLVHNK